MDWIQCSVFVWRNRIMGTAGRVKGVRQLLKGETIAPVNFCVT